MLGAGEEGELVLTTLSKQAMPMIRYRTRDITAILPGACPCGRSLRRMKRISRRSDDMLIIRGVNVFPSQIEEVLTNIPGVEPHYQIVVSREGHLDVLEVQVEVSPGIFSDTVRDLEQLEHRIAGELRTALSVSAKLKLVEPKTIARSEGKAKRVLDLRKEE